MNFLGISPLEFLTIIVIGAIVLGPKRLGYIYHDIKKIYIAFIRRKREFTDMIDDELDIEEIKDEETKLEFSEIEKELEEDLKPSLKESEEEILSTYYEHTYIDKENNQTKTAKKQGSASSKK